MSRTASTTDEIVIRPATEDDAGNLYSLLIGLARATGFGGKIKSSPDDLRRHGFRDTAAFQALIAERSGRSVGLSLYFYNFSSWRGDLGVYIQDLYVAEEVRGAGLGRKLIAETVKLAQARGATHLRLSVERTNTQARNFYSKLGLSLSAEELIFQAAGPAFEQLTGDPGDPRDRAE